MPTVEVITIGTELLLGEIPDTNSTYIARTLRDYGIDIYRIVTIGDNPGRISSAIKEALHRANIIITTGGLGPTVDDPTRQAVADATDRDLIFLEDLWEQIEKRFEAYGRTPTDNNRRQAFIPDESIPINNPVGTAPCFIVEIDDACVISLPGVPSEMKFILHESVIPYLQRKYALKSQTIKATVLHTASMGESVIDEIIGDMEEYSNPTVGLLAHPGQVDIRVTSKASSEDEALRLSEPIIAELYKRLGDNIYGQDEETLVRIIGNFLTENKKQFCLVEYGLNPPLKNKLTLVMSEPIPSVTLDHEPESLQSFTQEMETAFNNTQGDICFGIALIVNETVTVHAIFQDGQGQTLLTRTYGGPKDHAVLWAQNTGLDFLRRQLLASLD
jgi:competence/damage-inducible protein CinA-like protein